MLSQHNKVSNIGSTWARIPDSDRNIWHIGDVFPHFKHSGLLFLALYMNQHLFNGQSLDDGDSDTREGRASLGQRV
jgi:hypothetical protein